MFSVVFGSVIMALVKGAEQPLAQLEAALAIWAGAAKGETHTPMHLDVLITSAEFEELIKNADLRGAMMRAVIARQHGKVPFCPCCKAIVLPKPSAEAA